MQFTAPQYLLGAEIERLLRGLSKQVVEILEARFKPNQYPTVEEVQDVIEKVLIENGHARVAKAYILYREERNRRRRKEVSPTEQRSEYIPWAKMWSVLDWAVDHEVNTVDKLNHMVESDQFSHLIEISEAAYDSDLAAVYEHIIEQRKDQVRLSSSPAHLPLEKQLPPTR